jgi:hypothetical protein
LGVHQSRFEKYFRKSVDENSVKEHIEGILQYMSVHFRWCDKCLYKDFAATVLSNTEETPTTPITPFLVIKCLDSKRNIKFIIMAEREGDALILTSKLRSGEAKEFRSMIHKLYGAVKKNKLNEH